MNTLFRNNYVDYYCFVNWYALWKLNWEHLLTTNDIDRPITTTRVTCATTWDGDTNNVTALIHNAISFQENLHYYTHFDCFPLPYRANCLLKAMQTVLREKMVFLLLNQSQTLLVFGLYLLHRRQRLKVDHHGGKRIETTCMPAITIKQPKRLVWTTWTG